MNETHVLWPHILQAWTVWLEDSTGILMSHRQGVFDKALAKLVEPLIKDIETQSRLQARHLMINRIPPGKLAGPHTDTLKTEIKRRCHFPLQTSLDAWFWDEYDGFVHHEFGKWSDVNHTHRHAVGNFHPSAERVHLIVDLV